MVNSNFSGNTAGTGGAISGGAISLGGRLTVVDSVFSNNTAVDDGGALLLAGRRHHISGSAFSGNSAASGGAIVNALLGNLQLIDSVFDNNAATGATTGGGAIYIDSRKYGTVTLTNVTISGNRAKNNGGGVRDNISHRSV